MPGRPWQPPAVLKATTVIHDYLLGVGDETRQGALRFKTDADDVFQHPSPEMPKLIALPALLHAANAVARDEPDNLDAIKTLLDAGTGSLGGARHLHLDRNLCSSASAGRGTGLAQAG